MFTYICGDYSNKPKKLIPWIQRQCFEFKHADFERTSVNTLRPRQNGRRFTDDTFKCIFLNENVRISIKISLKFVPKGPIHINLAFVQIMACSRSGDKPLSEPMMVSLLMHICGTRPQWVKYCIMYQYQLLKSLTRCPLIWQNVD